MTEKLENPTQEKPQLRIELRIEKRRGCGYRKPGGLYMVTAGEGAYVPCLPAELHVCPTCSQGIKPGRGFQWIEPGKLMPHLCSDQCKADTCLLSQALEGTQGFMWVGGKYYPTPDDFLKESQELGISKRIPFVPKEFELGKHWIFLAHREAIPVPGEYKSVLTRKMTTPEPGEQTILLDPKKQKPLFKAGVFSVFKPTAIEYIVKAGEDSPEKLERLMSRGITLVEAHPEEPDTCQDTCPGDSETSRD